MVTKGHTYLKKTFFAAGLFKNENFLLPPDNERIKWLFWKALKYFLNIFIFW